VTQLRTAAGAPVLQLWTSHVHPVPLPPGHAFPSAKYTPLVERLLAEGIVLPANLTISEPAPESWLHAAHDPDYVARVIAGALAPDDRRVLGLPWSPELVVRARAAVFGTVSAARAARQQRIAGNLAGGSHHAFRDRPGAYCLLNDLAIAVAMLHQEGVARRVFVLDADVHQGDGTAVMLADDSTSFTYSIHAAGNYPARKQRSTLDVELPDGAGDTEFLDALDATLPAALDRHRPDFVLYQAGVDGLAADRFGRLAMTLEGLGERDACVFRACLERELPVAVTLGGGYGQPLETSVEAHAGVWRTALACLRER
jgi:acetoin utilization deacetylase AcuC-like enzyme